MTPRQIAIFLRYLPMGGIQKLMVRLANAFVERGYQVDLVLAKGGGALESEVSGKIRIIDLKKDRVWLAVPDVVRYLRDERPDVLLTAEAPVNLVGIWAWLARRKQPRLVLTVLSNMTEYARSREIWYGPIIPKLIRMFYARASSVTAVSKGVLKDLIEISSAIARNGVAIYPPVVDQTLYARAQEPVEHPWFAESSTTPVIVNVGRLTRQKNHDLLIRAFARVREHMQARLVIIGDGNQKPELEALIKRLGLQDAVALLGFDHNPYKYVSRASLFVLSSNFEGFGLVLVESLALGCPVVSTDCPDGPREILDDGRYGTLVPVDDEAALASAIEKALAADHDVDLLKWRGREFDVATAADHYLKVLFPQDSLESNGTARYQAHRIPA